MKDYLVCIICGPDALHQKWIQDHKIYNFDLALLSYTDVTYTDLNSKSAKYHIIYDQQQIGGVRLKLFSHFLKNEVDYKKYKRIFIFDDDITTSPSDINTFLDNTVKYEFDLAQPSLTKNSYGTYPATFHYPQTLYRLTNTVEIMMPCYSPEALDVVIPFIDNLKYGYGWGLELLYDKFLHKDLGNSVFGGFIGIIDITPFGHYRPLGENGLYFLGPPHQEIEQFEKIYDVKGLPQIRPYWGRLK